MTLRMIRLGIFILVLSVFGTACGKKSSDNVDVPSFPPTEPGPPELPYCSTTKSYSGGVTISGNASYKYREPDTGISGLSAVRNTPRPIRRAEVRVLNSSGNVAQCATTDNLGNFSFTLPQGTQSYTVQVNSRAYNSHLRATVFDLPENKVFYSLSAKVVPDANKTIADMIAPANGTVLAGAFNILDQLLVASEYLRAQVGNCSVAFAGCKDFTVAPKVEVFWKKGFNPGSYFDSGPLSFYLPGYGRLFILGGVNGDVDYTDTDHFDNSVILHEFGHFLEDQVFASDSPGGAHNGNKIIDPRLAWSEGWGNFLQAAVSNDPRYIDTEGNVDGQTSFTFIVNLENKNAGYDTPSNSPNSTMGEGNFREFSVTRLLWDTIDDIGGGDDDTIKDGFPQIWTALTKTSGGFADSKSKFRDIGLLHSVQSNLPGGDDWSTLRDLEYHIGDRSEYASFVTARSACNTVNGGYNYEITPIKDSASSPDLFRNNDFFHYRATTLLSNVRFRLRYTSSTALADLDLYLYNESARFMVADDVIAASTEEPTTGIQSEIVSVAKLPAGDYLLNVNAYTGMNKGIGSTNKYRIEISINNGSWTNLCEP